MNSVTSKVKFKATLNLKQQERTVLRGFLCQKAHARLLLVVENRVAESQETRWPGPDHGQTNVLTLVCFLPSHRLP